MYLFFLSIVLVLLIICKRTQKYGKLKNITKYEINGKIDETNNYKLKIPLFKKEAKFNRRINSTIQLKKGELIKFTLNAQETQLIITDSFYNIVHKINNPVEVNFTTEKLPMSYKLEENKKYLIFVRYNPAYEDFKSSLIKYSDHSKVPLNSNTLNNDITILNETNMYKEMEINSRLFIHDMKENNYIIQDFKYAIPFMSFPSNDLFHKVKYTAKKNDCIVIMTTNKHNIGCDKQLIEVNTNTKSFNWYPDCDKLFCTFIIDNDIDDNEFIIYERLINVDNKSNIMPFKLLVFNKDLLTMNGY